LPTTAEFGEYLKADIRPGETYELWKQRVAGERPDAGSVSAPQTPPDAGQPVQEAPNAPESETVAPRTAPQTTQAQLDDRRRATVRAAGAEALKPGSVQGYVEAGMAQGEEGFKTKGVAAIPESNVASFKILTEPEDPKEIEKLAKDNPNDPRLATPQAKAVLRDLVRRDFGIEVPPTAALGTWRTLSAAPKRESQTVANAKITPGVLPAVQEYTKQAGKGQGLELPKVTLMTGEEAINVSRLRNDLTKFYTSQAVRRAGASITAEKRKQIDTSAREIANSMVHEFIADNRDSSLLFADTDPDGTTRAIAKEGYVPGLTTLTGLHIPELIRDAPVPLGGAQIPGTGLSYPETVGEAAAPFLAVLSPYHHEATFAGNPEQLAEVEGIWSGLGWISRMAPSTLVGAWAMSDGEWGSPEHVEKIRQGYDLGQSTRDVGEWWAKTVFQSETGAEDHPYFTRVMGIGTVGAIVMLEPDVISLATLGAGKVAKAGLKGARVARAEKFVKVFDTLLAETAGEVFDVEKFIAKAKSLAPEVARALEAELRIDAGQASPVKAGLASKAEAAKSALERARKEAQNVVEAERADRGRVVSEGMAQGKQTARVEAAEMGVRAAKQAQLSAEWALNRAAQQATDAVKGGTAGGKKLIDALRQYGAAAQALENTIEYTPGALKAFQDAREAVIKAWDASAHTIAKQNQKRAAAAVKQAQKNLAAALTASTGVKPEAAAKIAARRTKALEKLEEATHAAEFPERLREQVIDVTTRWRDSFKKLADETRKGDAAPTRNPVARVVQGATAEGGSVDSRQLRAALNEAYGTGSVSRFLNTSLGRPIKDIVDQAGPVAVNGQQLAALFRSVDGLESFAAMAAKSETAEASDLLTSITSPNALGEAETWITAFERRLNKLKASMDPITRRHGQLSKAAREAVMALVGMSNRMKDELHGLHEMAKAEFGVLETAHQMLRDAQASGDATLIAEATQRLKDAEQGLMETLGKFLDGRDPIKMGVGMTAMNTRAETIFERFRRAIVNNVDVMENPGGDASKELAAVARAWLPTSDDLDPQIASMIQAALVKALNNGQFKTSSEMFDFVRNMTFGLTKNLAPKSERSLALAVAGVAYGAVADDLVQLANRAVVGTVDPRVAAAATDFAQRRAKNVKAAVDPDAEFADIRGIYEVFARWGVPSFNRSVATATKEAGQPLRDFVRFVAKDGDGHVIIPKTLMDDLREKMGKIEKELDVENVKGAATVGEVLAGGWQRYMRIQSTAMVVGLGLGKPKHYVNMLAGTFSQVWSTAGLPHAVAVTVDGTANFVAHAPGMMPVIGPHYTAWVDHLSTKYGERALTPISNAFMNPGVGAFYSGRKGTIKLGDRVWDLDDLREVAIQRGILSAHASEGIERNVGRSLSWLDKLEKVLMVGADNRKAIASLIEHRQRVATFLNHLAEGKGEERAASLTLDAYYDWNHPVAIAETSVIAKLVPFWRYHALSTQQLLKSALLPFIEPNAETFMKAMTGQTRIARTVRQASIAEEVPEWVHWSKDSEEEYEEWKVARAMVPWAAKQNAMLDLSRRPDGSWEYTQMPSFTALDKLGMFMTIGFGLSEALILGSRNEKRRALQAGGEPIVEEVGGLFAPLIETMLKAAADQLGVETYRPGDWVNPRAGEIELFSTICPEAVVTIRGERKVDAFTANVFRNLIPGAPDIVRAYAMATSDDPETQKSLIAAAGYTLRSMFGFKPEQFSPGEEAAKTMSFTAKDMKRAAGHEGIVAGAKQ
jgi:hypothetical protein